MALLRERHRGVGVALAPSPDARETRTLRAEVDREADRDGAEHDFAWRRIADGAEEQGDRGDAHLPQAGHRGPHHLEGDAGDDPDDRGVEAAEDDVRVRSRAEPRIGPAEREDREKAGKAEPRVPEER